MIEAFFRQIAERMHKENTVSDITWAVAEACQSFKVEFMRLFWPTDDFSSPFTLQREFSQGDSRFDIRTSLSNERNYIVEIKKYDRVDHYAHYTKNFPNCKYGFISIYHLASSTNYPCRTWDQLVKHMEGVFRNIADLETKALIQGYLKYIREVCTIMEYTDFSFQSVLSLHFLDHLMRTKLFVSNDVYEIEEYNAGKSKDNHRYGLNFYLIHKKTKQEIWPWFGIWFTPKEQVFLFEFEKGSCSQIYETLKKHLSAKQEQKNVLRYSDEPFEEEGSIWFQLKKDLTSTLLAPLTEANKENEIQYRVEVINSFFQEVLDRLGSVFASA